MHFNPIGNLLATQVADRRSFPNWYRIWLLLPPTRGLWASGINEVIENIEASFMRIK